MAEIPGFSSDTSDETAKNLFDIRDNLPRLGLPAALIAVILVCLTSFFSAVMTVNLSVVTAVLLSAFSSAVFALLLILCRKIWIFAACPAAAAAAIVFSFSSPAAAASVIFSQTFLVGGIVLAGCVYLGKTCSSSVFFLSAALAPWFALCLASFVILTPELFDSSRPFMENISRISSDLYNGTVEYIASLKIMSADGIETAEISYENAVQTANYLFLMSPSVIILGVMGTALLSSKILYGFFLLFGITDFLKDPKWTVVPKKPTAVIYCASYLLSLLFVTSKGMEAMYFAAYNTALIFGIPVAVYGFRQIVKKLFKNASARTKAAWSGLFVLLFIAGTVFFVSASAFFGSYRIIKKRK